MEATNTIRDALVVQIEPVYGLTTMHASLRAFQADPDHSLTNDVVKASSYAFGMIALGKFILRLPAEVLEEELPRLKGTLISVRVFLTLRQIWDLTICLVQSLNDKTSLVIRESAAVSIIAAQLVLRDETHLFALLDGLADDKKNLLTYLFDKHGTRGQTLSNGAGMEKLEKEMRRLDNRTNISPTN
jgi:CLIP-associating protein 1/2